MNGRSRRKRKLPYTLYYIIHSILRTKKNFKSREQYKKKPNNIEDEAHTRSKFIL